MEKDTGARPPFDQQAALEELERFGRDIQRYRAQREALGEEFETFVRSFKTPPDRAVDPPVSRPLTREAPRDPSPPPLPAPTVAAAPPPAPAPQRPPISDKVLAATAAPPDAQAPETAAPVAHPADALAAPVMRPRSPFPATAVAAAAVIVVLGGALLATVLWNRTGGPASPSASPETPVATAPAPSPAPAAAPPAAVPAPRTTESAITAERRVWMRVIVDGERVVEREVPAGTRIPLNAEKTIVIRTGDAGAVRLSLRGEDRGLLGREGEVVTRSFTVPPRQTPATR